MWIQQVITSFIASAAFGILFNAPRTSLVKCGFVGMVGWMIYFVLVEYKVDVIIATYAAAFFIAFISQFFARRYKTPIIIFSVAGIIPLVPGGLAYDAMRNIVSNEYTFAIESAVKVFLISGAIAIGLVSSEVVNQVIRKIQYRRQEKVQG
ncbi:threonine/serine exporter family protein [Bacillus pinisoli]|uniref:threonine/serine exporter family protein n=1 Tax=Bacillus pinisoli TaxID=2901866 RepID=UPI001FF52C01|nr:threonine/serine exporter family protein [Bacillus pinisoli]